MKILAVDDKAMPRKVLVRAIEQSAPDAEIVACASASEVLARPDADQFDVAFIDIDMPRTNGVELAKELKRLNPCVNVVFATGYGEYMADAFSLRSSGYLMKPITPADVASELDNLRYPLAAPAQDDEGKLVLHCFGNFEVFAQGTPVTFERTKTKELLAFLVDRQGAIVSLREAEAVLWEDSPRSGKVSGSYLRTLVADLRHSLEACGHGDVLIKHRGSMGIVTTKVAGDYYGFLAGDPQAVSSWRGEYMNQYAWAEPTKAALLR